MDEAEAAEFADPPRKWPRVGAMAGAWAIVLALGASVAPGFAASGSEENDDPRDEPATDAKGATWSYLRYGSNGDTDLAEAALCGDASPELTPADLDAIRQGYADELGGISDVDVETGDPTATADGISVVGTVSFISQSNKRDEEFTVTVQERDGSFCVSNATQPDDESEQPSIDESAEPGVDPEVLATDFLRSVVLERNPMAATAMQCDSYSGITAQALDQAMIDWAAPDENPSGYLNAIDPIESGDDAVALFEVEAVIEGNLTEETFTFQIGVQDDCVASLEGGEGLIAADD
ncbi:hypothetical protein [Glycomyces harbinensis]|uniref:hypothetical protein n=1 Tax=Glycomyces harbinensis TaxID=58114 RepID=UPI00115FF31C|nr:hypothetical protein [Glycomyces harbinensis]